jgi:hypothetical protein
LAGDRASVYDGRMAIGRAGARHAGSLYRRAFRGVLRPVQKVEAEAHHLHDVEHTGESAETPAIAMLGVFLFVFPIFVVMLGIAFGAYYLAK